MSFFQASKYNVGKQWGLTHKLSVEIFDFIFRIHSMFTWQWVNYIRNTVISQILFSKNFGKRFLISKIGCIFDIRYKISHHIIIFSTKATYIERIASSGIVHRLLSATLGIFNQDNITDQRFIVAKKSWTFTNNAIPNIRLVGMRVQRQHVFR